MEKVHVNKEWNHFLPMLTDEDSDNETNSSNTIMDVDSDNEYIGDTLVHGFTH
ncbi:hypothetical protein KI387_010551, partial [Taxus chinensis]